MTRYSDADGNEYHVEQSGVTGKYLVIRTNPQGNRKMSKTFEVSKSRELVQHELDTCAEENGWRKL